MKDNTLNALQQFYGVDHLSDNVVLSSIQCDWDDFKDSNLVWSHISKTDEVLLFFSVNVEGFIAQRIPLAEHLKSKYGLHCSIILEQHRELFATVIRTGVAVVSYNQCSTILKVLYDLQYHSFCVVTNKNDVSSTCNQVFPLFENGVLTPKVLSKCCTAILSSNAIFLHLLRGVDGYSINFLYNK